MSLDDKLTTVRHQIEMAQNVVGLSKAGLVGAQRAYDQAAAHLEQLLSQQRKLMTQQGEQHE